jgi:hypothetical protein
MSRAFPLAIILASAGAQVARPFEDDDARKFLGAKDLALHNFSGPKPDGKRADADVEFWGAHYEHRFDKLAKPAGAAGDGKRADADGVNFARDLDFIRRTVIEEKYAVPNGMRLFRPLTDVPVGARSHWVRRGHEQGEAGIYRAGMAIPRATVSSDEEEFPVRHIVDAFDIDMFEQNSSNFAGSNVLGRKSRAARNLIVQRQNRLIWYGSDIHGLYGVLNYPWLPKAVSAVPYDGSAAADDVIADLNKWADYPSNSSNAVFSPTRMVTSPRVRNYLMSTPRSATTDTSIGKWFLANNNPDITQIDSAWELQGTGPGGTDVILFYRDDTESLAYVPVGGMSMLPVQREGFTDTVYMYQSFGGVVMPDVGNNVAVFVTPPPLGA